MKVNLNILETTGKQVAVRGFDFLNYNTTHTGMTMLPRELRVG